MLSKPLLLSIALLSTAACTKELDSNRGGDQPTQPPSEPATARATPAPPPAPADAASSAAEERPGATSDEAPEPSADTEAAPCGVEDEFAAYADVHDIKDDLDQRREWVREQAERLLPSDQAEAAVGQLAVEIRDALVAEDFRAVARHVQGERGVCLRASKGARCSWMSTRELRSCATQQRKIAWAIDTGADELPRYTCSEAFQKLFLAHPALSEVSPNFNCFPARPDNNATSLISGEPPAHIYVEFFADEVDDERSEEYHPWLSLWLLFERRGAAYSLSGITSQYWGI